MQCWLGICTFMLSNILRGEEEFKKSQIGRLPRWKQLKSTILNKASVGKVHHRLSGMTSTADGVEKWTWSGRPPHHWFVGWHLKPWAIFAVTILDYRCRHVGFNVMLACQMNSFMKTWDQDIWSHAGAPVWPLPSSNDAIKPQWTQSLKRRGLSVVGGSLKEVTKLGPGATTVIASRAQFKKPLSPPSSTST